jgi:hypothetical protein
LTDEQADEKETREDEANAGHLIDGLGCCLLDLFIAATAFTGLMFVPFHLLR